MLMLQDDLRSVKLRTAPLPRFVGGLATIAGTKSTLHPCTDGCTALSPWCDASSLAYCVLLPPVRPR
eukprot:3887448-Heterocapsa_arctica.AAC.1